MTKVPTKVFNKDNKDVCDIEGNLLCFGCLKPISHAPAYVFFSNRTCRSYECDCEHAIKYNDVKEKVNAAERVLESAQDVLRNFPLSDSAKEYLYQEGLKELEFKYRK